MEKYNYYEEVNGYRIFRQKKYAEKKVEEFTGTRWEEAIYWKQLLLSYVSLDKAKEKIKKIKSAN